MESYTQEGMESFLPAVLSKAKWKSYRSVVLCCFLVFRLSLLLLRRKSHWTFKVYGGVFRIYLLRIAFPFEGFMKRDSSLWVCPMFTRYLNCFRRTQTELETNAFLDEEVRPWSNGLARRSKLKTWVYLRLRFVMLCELVLCIFLVGSMKIMNLYCLNLIPM